MTSDIQKVIDNGYCIGCGACTIANDNFSIKRNQYGLKTAYYLTTPEDSDSDVCPFASSKDETELGKKLYDKQPNIQFEKKLGYYLNLYAGKMLNESLRKNTSSGGLLTWLLLYLIENNVIDGVIHVSESTNNDDDLFNYNISTSLQEITSRSKSRYYHVSFADIKDFIKSDKFSGKYVFVGVPCYIKAMRLLCLHNPHLSQHILFFFGIFCGHMKTSAFAELFAWQQGIAPHDISKIDFRVKNETGLSSQYSVQIKSRNQQSHLTQNYKLYGADWGLGFFKPKACDWCDDISAELADITFGDAWLPEYTNDSLGTNIVIVRHPQLDDILQKASTQKHIVLEKLSEEKIIQSQAGNYRHRQEGLSIRLESANNLGKWTPSKRVNIGDYQVTKSRKKLYLVREEMSKKSHLYFYQAKNKSNIALFALKMLPLEIKYHFHNKRLIKGTIKSILNLIRLTFKIGDKS